MEEFEIWMPVKGYEGVYEVSHFGRVKRVLVSAGTKGGLLKQCTNKQGRVCFRLGLKNVAKTFYAHHLVLINFNCDRPEGMECCHNDGNPLNNYIGNLRWDTHQENMNDQIKHGTSQKGELASRAKLRDNDINDIKNLIKKGIMQKDIAAIYLIDKSIISKINSNKIWSHL